MSGDVCPTPPEKYNSKTCKLEVLMIKDIGNYCLPNLNDEGTVTTDIREAYNNMLDAIGADIVGKYIGDITLSAKVIYICAAASFFIA